MATILSRPQCDKRHIVNRLHISWDILYVSSYLNSRLFLSLGFNASKQRIGLGLKNRKIIVHLATIQTVVFSLAFDMLEDVYMKNKQTKTLEKTHFIL